MWSSQELIENHGEALTLNKAVGKWFSLRKSRLGLVKSPSLKFDLFAFSYHWKKKEKTKKKRTKEKPTRERIT